MAKKTKITAFTAVEDSGGGLQLFVFKNADRKRCIYAHSGYEYRDGALAADISALKNDSDPADWDGCLDSPQQEWDRLDEETGWTIIADETRIYVDEMGSAGLSEFFSPKASSLGANWLSAIATDCVDSTWNASSDNADDVGFNSWEVVGEVGLTVGGDEMVSIPCWVTAGYDSGRWQVSDTWGGDETGRPEIIALEVDGKWQVVNSTRNNMAQVLSIPAADQAEAEKLAAALDGYVQDAYASIQLDPIPRRIVIDENKFPTFTAVVGSYAGDIQVNTKPQDFLHTFTDADSEAWMKYGQQLHDALLAITEAKADISGICLSADLKEAATQLGGFVDMNLIEIMGEWHAIDIPEDMHWALENPKADTLIKVMPGDLGLMVSYISGDEVLSDRKLENTPFASEDYRLVLAYAYGDIDGMDDWFQEGGRFSPEALTFFGVDIDTVKRMVASHEFRDADGLLANLHDIEGGQDARPEQGEIEAMRAAPIGIRMF